MSSETENRWEKGEPLEKLQAMLRKTLTESSEDTLSYDDAGQALPPWRGFPAYERYSLGWRMGGGEDYWCSFSEWFRSMDSEHRRQYQTHHPAPDGWDDYYELIGTENE
ncbi:MAG: hypothetical protein H6913_03430 [Altererythrobacter sp.]|nr:hypothetical protein [Altererythrobacter sp.]